MKCDPATVGLDGTTEPIGQANAASRDRVSDEEILDLLWSRSEEGLRGVREKYQPLCHRLAMNLLGQREDAEECVSDVYMAVWESIPPNRPASLSAYVAKVTRNIAISYIRKREALCRRCGGTVLIDELAECLPEPDALDPVDDLTLRDALNAFFRSLLEEDRAIMLRRYYDGECVETIAKDVRIRPGTLRVRLHRLRERLRRHLADHGITV
jgi:RNA polymerase sigma-70 factor (ECF subfamily)